MSSTNLDSAGFRTAAKALVEGFGTRSGLKTTFRATGPLSAVSREVQRTAFRVIQQALSDAYRRTDPGPVSVEVSHRSDVLTVRVTDGGKGHSDAAGTGASSTGIEARVLHLGGVLDTSSEASVTALEARIPTSLRSVRA
jgi:signal transduction histidine kinase